MKKQEFYNHEKPRKLLDQEKYRERSNLLNLISAGNMLLAGNCMPKKSPIDAPGALHHIIAWGSVQSLGKSVIRGKKTAKAKKYSLTGK
jgi:hypothetical protein